MENVSISPIYKSKNLGAIYPTWDVPELYVKNAPFNIVINGDVHLGFSSKEGALAFFSENLLAFSYQRNHDEKEGRESCFEIVKTVFDEDGGAIDWETIELLDEQA